MTNETGTTQEKLAEMRSVYSAGLDDKVAEIGAIAELIAAGGSLQEVNKLLVELGATTHQLAGTAGTFGFARLGNAARDIDRFCAALVAKNTPPVASDCAQLASQVAWLMQCREQPQETDHADQNLEPDLPQSQDMEFSVVQNILLVGDDPAQTGRLKLGLHAFGYVSHEIEDVRQFEPHVKEGHQKAIILDLHFRDSFAAGAEIIRKIRASVGIDCPIIVLTELSDFDTRLAAVRAGTDLILPKPVTLTKIVQLLDTLTTASESRPARVLIIDDDLDLLCFVKSTLEGEGMIVETVSNPLTILENMVDFCPELLLVDLQMPECSGKELATVIRQNSEYSGIPIVFLSGEANTEIQLDAMSVGADGFLTKPISSRHLISAIRLRVERFRIIRNLMARDSLTGLYNHATTWQLLESELYRARRSSASVSFAMLDIDHFKQVNDNYGHMMGDSVIKLLSSILTHRLRQSDIVGHLGGEEFGVIMPETPAHKAHSVMEEIRIAFAQISQNVAGSEAPITLSCGIATFPEYESAPGLSEAADQALYEAKAAGRNISVLAKSPANMGSGQSVLISDQVEPGIRDQPLQPSDDAWISDDQPRQAEHASEPKNAVIIDDNPMICEFIRPFAESALFQVEAFSDPLLFVESYRAQTDLIILDLHMPTMDGIEVLRFLGRRQSKALIILISGYDPEILAAARNLTRKRGLNIIAALHKPLDQKKLKHVLSMASETGVILPQSDAFKVTPGFPAVEELEKAIADGTLEVYFQPKISLPGKTVLGAEALARWRHPQKGFIPPDYFIPLAERNNLIGDLTNLVLKQALAQCKLLSSKVKDVKISINISSYSFNDLNLPETFADIVDQAGMDPSYICLELTETALVTDTIYVLDVLTRLRLQGFEISIDDFGTGRSSLTRLKELPFNEIKIDRSFVSSSHTDATARAIVKNTIDLAKSLGLGVVAEGVEKHEHLRLLESLGCDVVQGFFIAEALPPGQFRKWLGMYNKTNEVKGQGTSG